MGYIEKAEERGMVTALQALLGYSLQPTYDVIEIARVARLYGVADQLLQRLEALWQVMNVPVPEIEPNLDLQNQIRRFLVHKIEE